MNRHLLGSWHPNYPHTAEEQRAADWEYEHDDCEFCGNEFHVDELEKVECEGGDLGCPECRAFIAGEQALAAQRKAADAKVAEVVS